MYRILFLVFLKTVCAWSQDTSLMKIPYQFGDSTIHIIEHWGGSRDRIIFLNVHEDEVTSIETLEAFSDVDTIDYFYLNHQGTRRIAFKVKGKKYDIDPNRIYTKKGRRKTLKDGNGSSRKAKKAVKRLAEQILVRIPEGHTVVALHNNTDINYSIKSYLPEGDEAQNTKAIFINPKMDPDDFIYTTDSGFFEAFQALQLNVILQDNSKYVNDGSLSVYCGKKGIPYINIETQKGHFEEQMALIKQVIEVVRGR